MRAFQMLRLAAVLLAAGCASVGDSPTQEDSRLLRQTSATLERFDSDEDFLNYMRVVRHLAHQRGIWWAQGDGVQYAALREVPCPEGVPPPCYEKNGDTEAITVTGSRISSPPSSITNVQMRGVDEGDIVKQFHEFLVVLQDGRLFSVNTRPGGRPGLALVDRANVYRRSDEDTWYDEMLIHESRIVVIGYSYDRQAAEFSVFTISDAGRLTREATYYISSHDYYSSDNYATRLVDDRLIVRTVLTLEDVNPDKPMQWPVMRRWLREGKGVEGLSRGVRIFDARDIYRPVQPTLQPAIHGISVCPLGAKGAGDELDCRTTALIAPNGETYFVTREHAYLWVPPGWEERQDFEKLACDPSRATAFESGVPAALFQIPLSSGAPQFLRVRGEPVDQFSLDANGEEFRALLVWNGSCQEQASQFELKYFHAPLIAFAGVAAPAQADRYIALPALKATSLENRFTDRMLVYGGRTGWYHYPPDEGEGPFTARAVVVPLQNPEKPVVLDLPHNVIRAERAGDNAVLTGYRTDEGLAVSLLDLRAEPRLASTHTLMRRYESEGRSHAYNSLAAPDGSGLIGIPTVQVTQEAGRWWWRSKASDVSFLALSSGGALRPLGELKSREKAEHPSYKCEVSCVDWYGNTRPIFTDERVFALTATEMVEGQVQSGQIREIRRLKLTQPLASGVARVR